MTGKDVLKVSLPLTADDIPVLLEKLLTQYEAETYKGSFAWAHYLTEVRTKALIEKLDAALTMKIQGKLFERTWLSIPDIIEWSDVAGFKYQKPKQGDLHEDISWDSYLTFLGTETPHTAETFRKQTMFSPLVNLRGSKTMRGLFIGAFIANFLTKGDYVLNNGKWFKVNADFLKSLNDSIKQIPISSLQLPTYQGNDEGVYNEGVHKGNQDYFALMDKKLIQHGGGNSKIEFCDLFTTDKHLIHVKRYGGSSVLSHLFAQGTVSARLLLSDPDFRKKVNEKLPASHKLKNLALKSQRLKSLRSFMSLQAIVQRFHLNFRFLAK